MPKQYREPDNCITPEDKNIALANLLLGQWNPIEIIQIKRQDDAQFKGWVATKKNGDLRTAVEPQGAPAQGPPNPRPNRPPR